MVCQLDSYFLGGKVKKKIRDREEGEKSWEWGNAMIG